MTQKKQTQTLTLKLVALQLVLLFAAVLVFTFFDWLVHSTSSALAVPPWYFRNKIIFSTIMTFVLSLIFRKGSTAKRSLLIALPTVLLLEIRYAFYGYPLLFHAIVLPEHFIFLYISTFFALRILDKFAF